MRNMTNKIIIKETIIEEAIKVNETIVEFESYSKSYFEDRYKNRDKLIIVAYLDDQPAGYIVGYDRYKDGSFYCWMAGVDPEFRRKGILKFLMDYLDKWAKDKGYSKIRIKTRNNRRNMLAYLIKYGFYAIEVKQHSSIEENRILFEKKYMTKFILHGGNTSTLNSSNNDFFVEIIKDVPNKGRILIVYFSRKEEEYHDLFKQDEVNFLSNAENKELELVIAKKEQFINQLKEADAIYIRGGDTFKLLEVLKHSDFIKNIGGKIVAGSSAGAYVLSRYFFSRNTNDIHKGLGFLPIKIICHYEGEQGIIDRLKEFGDDLEIVSLRDYEFRVFNQ